MNHLKQWGAQCALLLNARQSIPLVDIAAQIFMINFVLQDNRWGIWIWSKSNKNWSHKFGSYIPWWVSAYGTEAPAPYQSPPWKSAFEGPDHQNLILIQCKWVRLVLAQRLLRIKIRFPTPAKIWRVSILDDSIMAPKMDLPCHHQMRVLEGLLLEEEGDVRLQCAEYERLDHQGDNMLDSFNSSYGVAPRFRKVCWSRICYHSCIFFVSPQTTRQSYSEYRNKDIPHHHILQTISKIYSTISGWWEANWSTVEKPPFCFSRIVVPFKCVCGRQ